jgi:hypothetical protein
MTNKLISLITLVLLVSYQGKSQTQQEILKTAEDFLYATRLGESTLELRQKMKMWKQTEFSDQLNSDTLKLAFWLNIYNALVQDELSKHPELYSKRSRFFKANLIDIAGVKLSLDNIEHGLLRKSSLKFSFGYLHKLFPTKTEKNWRVDKIDPRIHFALNCGASSCPAINWYSPGLINEQLNLASKVYLDQTILIDSVNKTIGIPKLFSWFRGDFGAKSGIGKFICTHYSKSIPENYELVYLEYSWALKLKSFQD